MKTDSPQIKSRLRRGDSVKVLRGRDRGKTGKVLAVLPREGRLVVEGINMVFKHVRARRGGEKGQRVSIAAPLPIANAQLICPSCKKPTRVGISIQGDERVRVCKKCNSSLVTK